jgi:hypothetical protein
MVMGSTDRIKPLSTIKEIAAYVRRDERIVRKWIREESFPAMLIGGQYITTPELIGQWLIERWVKEKEG